MQASIADILENRERYTGQVVNVDGILLITDYSRASAHFEQVWLVKKHRPRDRAIRARPIRSNSTLWHGLSRLNPRHMAGYQTYRVHDAVRACVRVLRPSARASESEPAIDILTAAIYRDQFTLYVGDQGVRLDQALPAGAMIIAVPDIQANIARYLGRRCLIYGTLVVRSSPAAQFLLPGRIPYAQDFRSSLARSSDDVINDDGWRISSIRRATASRRISTRCRSRSTSTRTTPSSSSYRRCPASTRPSSSRLSSLAGWARATMTSTSPRSAKSRMSTYRMSVSARRASRWNRSSS